MVFFLFAPAHEVPNGVVDDGSIGMGITCNANAPTGYQMFMLAGFGPYGSVATDSGFHGRRTRNF